MNRSLKILILSVFLLSLVNCGYNEIQVKDEEVTAAWSEVLSQYKRRADLIPNLLGVAKSLAKVEKDTYTQVAQARANAGGIKATPELLNDPAAFHKFEQAQNQMSGALSRLMLTFEKYPDLKSSPAFQNVQTDLEGTENRLAVARKRYIDSVKEYNILIRTFPTVLTAKMFGYAQKPNFTVSNEQEIQEAPKLDFDVN